MTSPRRTLSDGALHGALDALRAELEVPTAFSAEVEAAAAAAVARGPAGHRQDARHVPLVTIDPPGSMDLDQAVHVEGGVAGASVVRYAIADVASFVTSGDPVDVEAWARVVTRYMPDTRAPLHPPALSEGAASLLPGVDRPAVLWTISLDGRGDVDDVEVERAWVRSRSRLTYAEAQAAIDAGTDPMLLELSRVGRLRTEREWVRGGISLELPDQEVLAGPDGGVEIAHRAPLPVEGWNAQISLLTGIVAGTAMVDAGVGVLRTLPAPDEAAVADLRRRAWALGLPWPPEVSYAEFVRTLDPHRDVEAAMISHAAVGLRGAGYVAFTAGAPEDHRHEAIAAPYAHVTAPLRRLVDRYATEVVLSVTAGEPIPGWVHERLGDLPTAMAQGRGRAGALDRAVLDLVEAWVLAGRVGEVFAATVVRSGDRGSDVQLRDPVVATRVSVALPVGTEVRLRLDGVDVGARSMSLVPVG